MTQATSLQWKTLNFTGKRFQMSDSVTDKNRTGTVYPDNRCSPNVIARHVLWGLSWLGHRRLLRLVHGKADVGGVLIGLWQVWWFCYWGECRQCRQCGCGVSVFGGLWALAFGCHWQLPTTARRRGCCSWWAILTVLIVLGLWKRIKYCVLKVSKKHKQQSLSRGQTSKF